MSLKHTPGPWTDDCVTFYIHGANGHAVACCLVYDDTPASYNEALANLRLITEAPAMLEVLRECASTDPYTLMRAQSNARVILARLGNEVIQ